jgi:photosystem I reaction center PsaK
MHPAHGPSTHTLAPLLTPRAGFTIVDTLAMGAAGHVFGVGIVLGLRGIGAL